MLVFSLSDKGGTGRSVTSTNAAYRAALAGRDACYLDFDFGSPTIGAIFDLRQALTGVEEHGLHEYIQNPDGDYQRLDVWSQTNRRSLFRPAEAGKLTLIPGSSGGSEFRVKPHMVDRCVELFQALDEEYELILVDLSAGRSFAVELALKATARPELARMGKRWLVFHRWTRQHVIAASNLVYGAKGLVELGRAYGLDEFATRDMVRFVRTAVIDPYSETIAHMRGTQIAWLAKIDEELTALASRLEVGHALQVGSIPLDPVLQWREQLITDEDVRESEIANRETAYAFERLAETLIDPDSWES
jgi:hypothetical protein